MKPSQNAFYIVRSMPGRGFSSLAHIQWYAQRLQDAGWAPTLMPSYQEMVDSNEFQSDEVNVPIMYCKNGRCIIVDFEAGVAMYYRHTLQ